MGFEVGVVDSSVSPTQWRMSELRKAGLIGDEPDFVGGLNVAAEFEGYVVLTYNFLRAV